jgi:glycosyltransferase involved in cell wall biosynthesis
VVATHDHDLTCVRSHRYLPLSLEPCHRPPGLACVTHGCCAVRDRRAEARFPIRLRSPYALRRRLLELAARAPLVANSRYVAMNLINAGVEARRVCVIHPLPPDDSRPLVPRPREKRLLVVGQLLRGKGFDIAINALASLPGDVSLHVVGDGPSRAALAARAASVAPGRVHFHGYVPPDRIGSMYDAASVVLVPSRWPEPFGMVGIEAMRRARPVVGADHGAIPEWLNEEGGLLFEPGSATSLAGAAQKLLEDPEAGTQAREFASCRFPHARSVDEVEALLQRTAR